MADFKFQAAVHTQVWWLKQWTSGSIRSNDASLACHHKLNTIDICGGIIEMNV
jgi:hypothetical protein